MRSLTGVVQHYAWGDTEAIPAILGREPDGSDLPPLRLLRVPVDDRVGRMRARTAVGIVGFVIVLGAFYVLLFGSYAIFHTDFRFIFIAASADSPSAAGVSAPSSAVSPR